MTTKQKNPAEARSVWRELRDALRGTSADYTKIPSRLTVEAIAQRLGFSEPTSFSRAFRRWTGMTPRTFRNRPTGGH